MCRMGLEGEEIYYLIGEEWKDNFHLDIWIAIY